jgi:hypothetical protein
MFAAPEGGYFASEEPERPTQSRYPPGASSNGDLLGVTQEDDMNAFADTKTRAELDRRIQTLAEQYGHRLRGDSSYGQEAAALERIGADQELIDLLRDAQDRWLQLAIE